MARVDIYKQKFQGSGLSLGLRQTVQSVWKFKSVFLAVLWTVKIAAKKQLGLDGVYNSLLYGLYDC